MIPTTLAVTERPRMRHAVRLPVSPWGLWMLAPLGVVVVVGAALPPLVLAMMAPGQGSYALPYQAGLWAVGTLAVLCVDGRLTGRDLGLGIVPLRRVAIFAAAFAALGAAALAVGTVAFAHAPLRLHASDLQLGTGVMHDAVVALAFCAVGPVAQELLFRAGLMKVTRDALAARGGVAARLAAPAAVAASTAVFTAVHAAIPGVHAPAHAALLGLVCAVAYLVSGSLVVPVLVHSGWATWALAHAPVADGGAAPEPWLLPALPVAALVLVAALGAALPCGERRLAVREPDRLARQAP